MTTTLQPAGAALESLEAAGRHVALLVAEIGQLKAENTQWRVDFKEMVIERNDALARLAELEKQEPMSWTVAGDVQNWSKDFSKYKTQHYTRPVYAAAGAYPQPTGSSVYECPKECGCWWRDNHDGTMSLFDGDQKSCNYCEPLPLHKLKPLRIEDHLIIEMRNDGKWLVCINSEMHDHPDQAQKALKRWQAAGASPVRPSQAGDMPRIESLIGEYWDLAYREGCDGVSHGTEAQRVLSELIAAINAKGGCIVTFQVTPEQAKAWDAEVSGLTQLQDHEPVPDDFGDVQIQMICQRAAEWGFSQAAQPAKIPTNAIAAITLVWSNEMQPCEDCRYNHTFADSPLGRFNIEWKGWKEHDSRTVYLNGEHIGDSYSVEESKKLAQQYLQKLVLSLIAAQDTSQKEAPQQPFGWYDPSEDKFSRDREAHKRGATLWRVYRDAGVRNEG